MTVKERPILFKGEMVRAILEGRKTQTRRVMKPQPLEDDHPAQLHAGLYNPVRFDRFGDMVPGKEQFGVFGEEWDLKSPFGAPGDRLYVKETHCVLDGVVFYRADGCDDVAKWTPSIFMPRRASRITLEITGVRIERLNDISEEDAMAEGVRGVDYSLGYTAQRQFMYLWSSINGPESWEANPWVWVYEFKKILELNKN
jgi:hypothetical protein